MIYTSELPDLLPPSSRRHGIQLAMPFEEKRLNKWQPPYLCQPKFDGERCRTLIHADGTILQVSSECHEIVSMPHITDALVASGLRDIELDGELYCHGMNFEEIHSRVSRRVNPHNDYLDINLHLFDIIEPALQGIRLTNLLSLADRIKPYSCLQLAPCRLANNLDDVMRILDEYVTLGYEGIIIRHLGAPYERKRSLFVMKFKPRRSDAYTIIGFEEAFDKHGYAKNMLGALICSGDDGSEQFNVGTGFTEQQRIAIWANPQAFIGKTVEVAYQHLTHERGVPKFSSFLRIIE